MKEGWKHIRVGVSRPELGDRAWLLTFRAYDSRILYCRYVVLRSRFRTEGSGQAGYVSEVVLPNNSAVKRAKGYKMPKKPMAVASACLVAVKRLHEAWHPCSLQALEALYLALKDLHCLRFFFLC